MAVGLTAAAVGWGSWLLLDNSQRLQPLPPPPVVSAPAVAVLYATALPDIAGRPQALQQWRDKTLVVNYWATWCLPCREEMPMFSRLHQRYAPRGVQFVGIAADGADEVREFARQTSVSYPLLIGGQDAIKPTRDFGNAPLAVPFTVVLDRAGQVRAAVLGRVREDALVDLLDQL
ncbi:MAG: TlpA family protein disulfide reductase [Betaproteobacteria bacterium]|nr:TlpA family protein disulfide reductase [Betaproteobacteria bacterium]